jgi:hypothetical protein
MARKKKQVVKRPTYRWDQVHPDVRELAHDLVDGDRRRLEIVSPNEVLVLNAPRS